MAVKTYGSANSQARQILDFYGSANDQAQTATKVYGQSPETGYIITGLRSGAIDLGRFNSMYYRTFGPFLQKPYKVSAMNYTNNTVLVSVRTWAGEFINDLFSYPQGEYNNEGVIWGIDTEPVPSGSSVLTIALFDASSSVQPISRLIYQGFGHLDYYGTVTYYTDSNHTDIATQTLHSAQNIRGLSGYSHQNRLTWSVTINGVSISNKDIYGVTLTEKLKALPSYFLSGCSALNSDLILPSSLIAINDSGEQNGSAFLYRCDGMTATVNVGNLPTSIVKSITNASFSTGSNSSAAFTQGIKIAGANRAAWLAAFPNRSSYTPYRKLVDAGY